MHYKNMVCSVASQTLKGLRRMILLNAKKSMQELQWKDKLVVITCLGISAVHHGPLQQGIQIYYYLFVREFIDNTYGQFKQYISLCFQVFHGAPPTIYILPRDTGIGVVIVFNTVIITNIAITSRAYNQ